MEITGSVIAITGASSGIGRATAERLARRGARLVLTARREELLGEVARECERLGGEALAAPADVTDEQAVREVGERGIERFGGIDAWVNNAGVYAIGRFEEIPADAFRQAVEVDLFGTVHGSRVAIPHFRSRGRGVLVNVGSMLSAVGAPYASAYTAAKWAVRGFTESLREELLDEPEIHACLVMPASIDTPIFQHAANYTRRPLKALPPVYHPEKVAETIEQMIGEPRREATVGAAARATILQHAVVPGLTERMLRLQIERTHFSPGSEPATPGNLFEPIDEGAGVSGGWRRGDGNVLGRSKAATASRARAVRERSGGD